MAMEVTTSSAASSGRGGARRLGTRQGDTRRPSSCLVLSLLSLAPFSTYRIKVVFWRKGTRQEALSSVAPPGFHLLCCFSLDPVLRSAFPFFSSQVCMISCPRVSQMLQKLVSVPNTFAYVEVGLCLLTTDWCFGQVSRPCPPFRCQSSWQPSLKVSSKGEVRAKGAGHSWQIFNLGLSVLNQVQETCCLESSYYRCF